MSMFGKKNDPETKAGSDAPREPSVEIPKRAFRPEAATSSRGPAIPGGEPRRGPDLGMSAQARRAELRSAGEPPSRAYGDMRGEGRPVEARHADVNSSGDVNTSKLIVGRDIILHGEIRACQNLVVEGRVEAALTDCRSIEIAASGVFKGSAHIQTADISGRFEGDLVVTNRLIVRSTGRIVGTIRYGQLEIERGGVVSGQIEVLASNEPGHEEEEGAERLIPAEAI
jgi:cytoskeletal protein CcmA (bactofilin family)